MPRVTGLRERKGGRVAVEVDGAPWRTLPVDAVVRAELRVGSELDRPVVRALARELRRSEALGTAVRALRRRDYSERALDARLRLRGVRDDDRRAALGTLGRAGLLDDERFARTRADALAARGYGNEAIRWILEQEGVAAELVVPVVEALRPETERAAEIAARRGAAPATAAYLVRRGFGEEAIESALGEAALGG